MELKGIHRKYLRGLAHGLKPLVLVGKSGVTAGLLVSVNQALDDHELIKVRFVDHKDSKNELALRIAGEAKCSLAGLIGNVAIFYRQQADPGRRKIVLPKAGKETEEGKS
jgi:RNA-binding protein